MSKAWSSDLETGVAEIDAGNKKIVEHINNLYKAKESGNTQTLEEVIEHLLLEHVCTQFILEEHMMDEAGYEFASAHEKVHELFAKKVGDLRVRIQKGEAIFDELIDMLENWLEGHIRNEDQMYAETLQVKIEQEGGQSWVKGVMQKLFG